jgi:hypothetical protein
MRCEEGVRHTFCKREHGVSSNCCVLAPCLQKSVAHPRAATLEINPSHLKTTPVGSVEASGGMPTSQALEVPRSRPLSEMD